MSIRIKQLILLLAIALIPVAISGWHSIHQIDAMADTVAESARREILERDRHYMTEKVSDIGRALVLMSQSTRNYLRQQQVLMELALALEPQPDVDFLLSEDVPQAPDAVDEKRFSRVGGSFPTPYVKVTLERPSFLIAPDSLNKPGTRAAINNLASIGDGLKAIHQETSDYSLWHYVALDAGVGMVYPGHGEYPENYDPRQRHWYRTIKQRGELAWMPLTIDASTGQPVLTAAAPVRTPDGAIVGATAIDLPLRRILNFHTIAQPWLNDARLALLQGDSESLTVIAMKEPLELDSDWNTAPQERALQGLTAEELQAIRALRRGESLLLESVSLRQNDYMLAVTALSDEEGSWLALASPTSATEAAVRAALAALYQERDASLRRHLIGAGLLAAIVALIALIASRRVTAPLIAMSETTEAIAKGNLESRTGLGDSKDEVGLLSRSIDHMADSIERLLEEQENAYRNMVTTLTRALEKKDSYTAAHSGRVTRYSLKLGERIGLDEDTLEKLRFGAVTHDLGKIGIADNVLNKPAPLDDDEFEIMKQHPRFSQTIMKPLVRFREYAEIAGSHHEHWNGKGYPDGLQGEEIPLLARIVAIADAWDAMTGDRVYRKGMPVEKAIAILDDEKDQGQFDPKLIRVFLELVREEYDLV